MRLHMCIYIYTHTCSTYTRMGFSEDSIFMFLCHYVFEFPLKDTCKIGWHPSIGEASAVLLLLLHPMISPLMSPSTWKHVKTIASLAGVVPWGPSSSHPWLRCFSAMEAEGFWPQAWGTIRHDSSCFMFHQFSRCFVTFPRFASFCVIFRFDQKLFEGGEI